MSQFSRAWNNVIQIGVKPQDSYAVAKDRIFLNTLAMIFLILNAIQVFTFIYYGITNFVIVQTSGVIFFATVIFVNFVSTVEKTKLFYLLGANFFVSVYCLFLPKETGEFLLFFVVVFLELLLYVNDNSRTPFFLMGLTFLCLVAVELIGYGIFVDPDFPPEQIFPFFIQISVLIVALVAGGTFFASKSNIKQLNVIIDNAVKDIQDIFRNSPDPILILNPETFQIEQANIEAHKLFKFNENALHGMNIEELTRDINWNIIDSWKQLLEAGGIVNEETKFNLKNGNFFWASITLTNFRIYDREILMMRISNITKNKENEFVLQSWITNLKNVQKIADIGYCYFSKDLNEVHGHNDQILYHFGINKKKRVSIDQVPKLFQHVKKESFENFKNMVLQNGNPRSLEFQFEINLSKKRFVYARVDVINDEQIILITLDITQQKEKQLALQRNLDELKTFNRELDDATYGATHDLRAPVASIIGLLDLIKRQNTQVNFTQYVDLIEQSCLRLKETINSFLDYARSINVDPKFETLDVKSIIEETIRDLKFLEQNEKVTVETQFTITDQFQSDLFKFKSIVKNLVSNAFKYSKKGNANAKIRIRCDINRDRLKFIVQDNGIGIPKEYQERVFQRFFRASNQSFGTGLGLHMTKLNVEKLGGTIEFESEIEVGTTFKVHLPNRCPKLNT